MHVNPSSKLGILVQTGGAFLGRSQLHGRLGFINSVANAYPVIFRVATVDPSDDTFTLSTDCPAGRDMFEVIQSDSLGLLMLVARRTSQLLYDVLCKSNLLYLLKWIKDLGSRSSCSIWLCFWMW